MAISSWPSTDGETQRIWPGNVEIKRI
uniref:Uncharacterized protein n=1 Tax=Anguilla anguilla TaxID=7936 RepID=A0A0E9PM25_ANGAN